MARIRWGVIGSGGIARRRTIPEGIVPACNAELAAVCGVDREANARLAREYGARAAADIDELLGADVDAVYVATPADLHHEHVLRSIRAGKHVLAEKPLGLTVADLTATQRKELKVKHGVRVEAAADAAARTGLREGDVILAVGNTEIANVREFEAAVAKVDRSKPINMLVQRGDMVQFVLIRASR